jgi:tRNA-(ms[2]io[6]A)-hydroxylase
MLKPDADDLQTLSHFLRIPTPKAWLNSAMQQIPLLLIDHAHCERKAASTALYFLSKYPDKEELVSVMSPLAREELLHFEKVITLLNERGIAFGPLLPSSYAQRLHEKITKTTGNARLCDQLIVGAIIEARSCERFNALAPLFDDKNLTKFYVSLVKAEARHFQDYLRLAQHYGGDISKRVEMFLDIENESISSVDEVFRVHSGVGPTSVIPA